MKADRIDLGLSGYDELFMSTEERLDAKKPKVDELPLDELKPFKDHPFKVMEDEEMERLKESIRDSGVLIPALARPAENGYELISGHRRLAACRALGLNTMPVIVRNLTDEEAVITMVDSNLQREHILPSEKAFAYKMKYDALKRSPGRPSKNASQLGTHLRTDEMLAQNSGDSRNQIQRYIRLTNLIPEILDMVDDGRIAFRPAVELSYLTEQEQGTLYDTMGREDCTPSLAQAIKMKAFSRDGKLTDAVILSIMEEEKPNQREQFRLPRDRINRFFKPGTPVQTIEDTIIRALELYRKRQRDMER